MTTAKVEPLTVAQPPKPAEPVVAEPAPTPAPVVEPGLAIYTEVAKLEEPPLVEAPKASRTRQCAGPPPPQPVEKAKIVPSFDTVRVEPSGEALIAGTAEPGSEVVVKFNGRSPWDGHGQSRWGLRDNP